MYSLTAFSSIYDNKTHKQLQHDTWDSFENMLYSMARIPGYKLKKGEFRAPKGVKASPLITPATYKPDTTRSNDAVIEWSGWAALDIDNHQFEGNLEQELKNKFGEYYYVCYSTSSSKPEYPKFRLVFPLAHSVGKDKIKHFWFSLNKEFDDLGDGQTKDLSRMYYVPATYPDAHNFIFTNVGSFINPVELMIKHQFEQPRGPLTLLEQMPPDIQKMIVAQRQDMLLEAADKNYTWTSYEDCPFVNKKLISEYVSIARTDGTGRYRMIYKIMASIACNAIKRKYPLTAHQLEELIRQLDRNTSNCYAKRPLHREASGAIEFAYKTT